MYIIPCHKHTTDGNMTNMKCITLNLNGINGDNKREKNYFGTLKVRILILFAYRKHIHNCRPRNHGKMNGKKIWILSLIGTRVPTCHVG